MTRGRTLDDSLTAARSRWNRKDGQPGFCNNLATLLPAPAHHDHNALRATQNPVHRVFTAVSVCFQPVSNATLEADAPDSKSGQVHPWCGFESHLRHKDLRRIRSPRLDEPGNDLATGLGSHRGDPMASLQERSGSFRFIFRYRGRQHFVTVGRVSRAEAEAKAAQVEYLLLRLKQGLLTLPPGIGIVEFVLADGQPVAKAVAKPAPLTLSGLRDRYLQTHSNGTLEERTLDGIRLHFKHLVRHMGEALPLGDLSLLDLQGYVDRRAKERGARGRITPATIRKEIVTLRTAWNWGVKMGLVAGRFPYDGLRYPKSDEKPPFQTRAEIERKIPGLSPEEAAEQWESLYLTTEEIVELLAFVYENAAHPWIHPILATAAYTGARRSELLRMQVADVDLEAGILTIRERKRQKGRRSTRRVPLSSTLCGVLRVWLAAHPGSPYLFCQAGHVARSRKRSRKTGYVSSDARPTTAAGRVAHLQERPTPGNHPLTENEAHDHLKRTLVGSKWEVVRGFHVLRHSFVSACASRGIDLRMLQEWCGHMSPEIQRRYMHLYPSVQAEAMRRVFG